MTYGRGGAYTWTNARATWAALTVNCRLSTVNFLEYVLQPQLNLPGRLIAVFICRLHDAERRRVEGSARNIKVRNIEKVKELEADFESSAFVPERDFLQHRKVEVVESRS